MLFTVIQMCGTRTCCFIQITHIQCEFFVGIRSYPVFILICFKFTENCWVYIIFITDETSFDVGIFCSLIDGDT